MKYSEMMQYQKNKLTEERKKYFNNEKFKEEILKRRMEQQYIADLLDISKGAVSHWTKDRSPSYVHYVELCELFKVDLQYFTRSKGERDEI
jgi:transcriptional regulator with XRE-family HTH domain